MSVSDVFMMMLLFVDEIFTNCMYLLGDVFSSVFLIRRLVRNLFQIPYGRIYRFLILLKVVAVSYFFNQVANLKLKIKASVSMTENLKLEMCIKFICCEYIVRETYVLTGFIFCCLYVITFVVISRF